MQKQTVLMEQLRPALTDALDRLVKKDLAQHGFVIVDHGPTKRYLQFCTDPATGVLLFDEGGVTDAVRLPPYEQTPMPDVLSAVARAEVLMRSFAGWSLSSEDEIAITEDDSESRWKGLLRKMKERIARLGESQGEPAPA